LDRRIGVKDEAEDLVARGEARGAGTGLLHHAGEVAPEDDGELVLG
jgi:hypothetical protein